MLAGWITFSALQSGGDTVARAQVLMRAGAPIFELGLALGGHRQEDRFWQHTLTQLTRHFDHEATVDTQVVCVDKRRQWSRWRNVWHSSAIRSTLYTLGAPLRGSSACACAIEGDSGRSLDLRPMVAETTHSAHVARGLREGRP